MFQQSLDAFLEQDSQLALKICKLDDEVDDLKNKMRIKVITDIQKDPEKSEKVPEGSSGQSCDTSGIIPDWQVPWSSCGTHYLRIKTCTLE